MRYFSIILKTNGEKIEKNATVKFKEYRDENPIESMNTYLYRHMENHIRFFAYREENDLTYAVFTYNEQKSSFQDAYDYIREQLDSLFRISRIKGEPSEITMHQFFTVLMEGRRRSLIVLGRYTEDCNVERFYADWRDRARKPWGYDFKEAIIAEKDHKKLSIYDPGFIKELTNIEENCSSAEYTGNPVHYTISARSSEAANEMTMALAHSLLKANRIKSRRVSIISELSPGVFNRDNRLEDIIENNYGGVMVIDLSERFGQDPEHYVMASNYIADLFKKYRNQCLFIFTYNMDDPGFAWYLLKQLNKYALTVTLKEGKGDRKAALSYLRSLIKNSEYSQYAGQASEFDRLHRNILK